MVRLDVAAAAILAYCRVLLGSRILQANSNGCNESVSTPVTRKHLQRECDLASNSLVASLVVHLLACACSGRGVQC